MILNDALGGLLSPRLAGLSAQAVQPCGAGAGTCLGLLACEWPPASPSTLDGTGGLAAVLTAVMAAGLAAVAAVVAAMLTAVVAALEPAVLATGLVAVWRQR
jgi:hypothetical protein